MDNHDSEYLEVLLSAHNKRLQVLELRAAREGTGCPPEVLVEIQEIKKSDYPFKVTFSPEINSRAQLDVFYHKPEKKYGNKCYDAFNMVMIKSNGDVIPAHGRCYNLKIGNLYDNDLRTIWNSPVISKFRKDLNVSGGLLPACSRCCSAFN